MIMKKRLLFSSIIITCLLLAACKKSGSGTNNWTVPMIKSETTNNNLTSYRYDKQGRLAELVNGDWVRVEYTYTRDSVFFKTTEIATNAVEKVAGKLDGNGMLIAQEGAERKYDNDGRILEEWLPPKSDGWQARKKYFYNSTSGFLDSTRQTESKLLQTRWLQTVIYTYYTDHNNTIGNENKGMGFLGKSSPYPVKKSETWHPKSAAPFRELVNTMESQYGYDEQERIVVEDHTEHRADNTIVQWRTVYAYY
jgi:hypothetical protein